MVNSRKDRIHDVLLSIPTINDKEHNLLLDRQRVHMRWLIDRGFKEGSGVLLIAGGMGEGSVARMILTALGMNTGPPLPAQSSQPATVVESHARFVQAIGILQWVDWDQTIFNGLPATKH